MQLSPPQIVNQAHVLSLLILWLHRYKLEGRLSGSHQNHLLTFDYGKLVMAAVEDLVASCV
jgi:hypothetical protein